MPVHAKHVQGLLDNNIKNTAEGLLKLHDGLSQDHIMSASGTVSLEVRAQQIRLRAGKSRQCKGASAAASSQHWHEGSWGHR